MVEYRVGYGVVGMVCSVETGGVAATGPVGGSQGDGVLGLEVVD